MGGKTSTSTQQVSIPPDVLARYDAVNAQAQQTAAQPFQQYSTNPNAFVAPLDPTQVAGIQNTNAAAGMAQPYYNAATGFALAGSQPINASPLDVGTYMNPYLNTVLGSTEAMVNQQNQQAMSGQTGNAISQGYFGGDRSGIASAVLAGQQQLTGGQLYSGIASDAYNQAMQAAAQQQGVNLGAAQANRAAQQQTADMLANLGTTAQGTALQGAQAQLAAGQTQQQTQQAGLSALYNQFLQQQSYPFQVAQFLANIAEGTGALSGSTTTTTQPGGLFSDARLKTDIHRIGKGFDGANIYRFRYIGDPDNVTRIGFMAQEVERTHPEAVSVDPASGFKMVDYDLATRSSAGFARAANDDFEPEPERRARAAGGRIARQVGGMSQMGMYPAGVNPFSISELLQAQAQMYAPFTQAGLYGQQGGGGAPYGGSARVPAGAMPVPALMTAHGLPPQPSGGLASDLHTAAGLAGDAKGLQEGAHDIHQGYDWLQGLGKPSLGDVVNQASAREDDLQGLFARGGFARAKRAEGGGDLAGLSARPPPGGFSLGEATLARQGFQDGGDISDTQNDDPYKQQGFGPSLNIPDKQTSTPKLATAQGSPSSSSGGSGLGQLLGMGADVASIANAAPAIGSMAAGIGSAIGSAGSSLMALLPFLALARGGRAGFAAGGDPVEEALGGGQPSGPDSVENLLLRRFEEQQEGPSPEAGFAGAQAPGPKAAAASPGEPAGGPGGGGAPPAGFAGAKPPGTSAAAGKPGFKPAEAFRGAGASGALGSLASGDKRDRILREIALAESGGRNIPNTHYGPGHTDQGYWQITDQTWKSAAPPEVYAQYQHAMDAPFDVQLQVARKLYDTRGTQPWNPSKGTWGPKIAEFARGGFARAAFQGGGDTDNAITLDSTSDPSGSSAVVADPSDPTQVMAADPTLAAIAGANRLAVASGDPNAPPAAQAAVARQQQGFLPANQSGAPTPSVEDTETAGLKYGEQGAAQAEQNAQRIIGGQTAGKPWYKNPDFWIPAITGVADMLAAPTKYPLVALTQGLKGGAQAYQGMRSYDASQALSEQERAALGLGEFGQAYGQGTQRRQVNAQVAGQLLSAFDQNYVQQPGMLKEDGPMWLGPRGYITNSQHAALRSQIIQGTYGGLAASGEGTGPISALPLVMGGGNAGTGLAGGNVPGAGGAGGAPPVAPPVAAGTAAPGVNQAGTGMVGAGGGGGGEGGPPTVPGVAQPGPPTPAAAAAPPTAAPAPPSGGAGGPGGVAPVTRRRGEDQIDFRARRGDYGNPVQVTPLMSREDAARLLTPQTNPYLLAQVNDLSGASAATSRAIFAGDQDAQLQSGGVYTGFRDRKMQQAQYDQATTAAGTERTTRQAQARQFTQDAAAQRQNLNELARGYVNINPDTISPELANLTGVGASIPGIRDLIPQDAKDVQGLTATAAKVAAQQQMIQARQMHGAPATSLNVAGGAVPGPDMPVDARYTMIKQLYGNLDWQQAKNAFEAKHGDIVNYDKADNDFLRAHSVESYIAGEHVPFFKGQSMRSMVENAYVPTKAEYEALKPGQPYIKIGPHGERTIMQKGQGGG